MKTDFYHLIILDESGSMSCVRQTTINGCNETLNTIRSTQEENADKQNHYVSIYVFQGGSARRVSRYLVKNSPIDKVENINAELYEPWGNTPLYDAIGSTLVDLKSIVADTDFAIGNVTIITDGQENSSSSYTLDKVQRMISQLKEIGWNFSFIGANIDVKGTARRLNIDNHLEFQQTEEGTRQMFARERVSRKNWARKIRNVEEDMEACCFESPAQAREHRILNIKNCNADYFEAPEQDEDSETPNAEEKK